jgi:hypothetical protein
MWLRSNHAFAHRLKRGYICGLEINRQARVRGAIAALS